MSQAPDSDNSRLRNIVEDPEQRLHFVGLAGSGMSALAHYRALGDGKASGSDRAIDQDLDHGVERERCRKLGIEVHRQDGSGVAGASLVVASTAVETTIPDLVMARETGIPVIHRSDLLALHVDAAESVAVAGTSGKSSVVAMIFEILEAANRDPALITGGDLVCLRERRHTKGNAWVGQGPLVFEADESDKSLTAYSPDHAVILNLQRDHDDAEAILPAFEIFSRNVCRNLVLGEDEVLQQLPVKNPRTFGFASTSEVQGTGCELLEGSSRFQVGGEAFEIPIPGQHNIENALAAIAVCQGMGVELPVMAAALRNYRGVSRRFEILGVGDGVEVIDDFAHNPRKIEATITTAQARCERLFAIFQPHGFKPARFMRSDLIDACVAGLRSRDRMKLLDIYFAGGNAVQDISSCEIAAEMRDRGVNAETPANREGLMAEILAEAKAGDTVLVMGARDPSLQGLARNILEKLTARSAGTGKE